MAVVDQYANSDLQDSKKAVPGLSQLDKKYGGLALANVANGDSNNSVFRLFKDVPAEMILADLELSFTAFGAAGAMNVGLWDSDLGAEIDNNCFANAVDISAAAAKQNGLTAVTLANRQKRLFEIAGHTQSTKKPAYDIGVIVTNVGATATGDIVANATFIQG